MKIYCLYGHGKETEVRASRASSRFLLIQASQRSYWYMQGDYEQDESRANAVGEEAFVRVEPLHR
jgi:phospholipid:diacylglycerol acyltransferase